MVLNLNAIGRVVRPTGSIALRIDEKSNSTGVVIIGRESAPFGLNQEPPLADCIVTVGEILVRRIHDGAEPPKIIERVSCAAVRVVHLGALSDRIKGKRNASAIGVASAGEAARVIVHVRGSVAAAVDAESLLASGIVAPRGSVAHGIKYEYIPARVIETECGSIPLGVHQSRSPTGGSVVHRTLADHLLRQPELR
jgi:hypothetical protein